MRLSEAIRLGAMMRPQAYDSDGKDGSCALRAASEALGLSDIYGIAYVELQEAFPILAKPFPCPTELIKFKCTMLLIIITLNDEYHWSRERIADWVEGIEMQREVPTDVPAHVPAHASSL